jgi:glycosyltransferase involved in cell wall biosynthesis
MSALALRDATIVCLSSIDWDFVWQVHQEIASRLAAAGNRVIFVENTGGVRSVRASDARRLLRRATNAVGQMFRGDRHPAANVTVVAPLLVPLAGHPVARFLNDRIFTRLMAAKIHRLSGDAPIVYTYLPTANALRLIELLGGQRATVVYHAVADFQALAQDPAAIARTEDELVRRANLVLVQSAGLRKRFDPLNANVHDLGIGVDLAVFDPAKVRGAEEIARLPRPVIGYVGGVHQHLDREVIAALARAFSAGSIVMVGPLLVDEAELPKAANIHYFGPRPHADLPAIVAGFDAGLIPYRRSTYTATVNPTKLFEYLAMGVPVVSTDLPEVTALGLPEDAVRIATEPASFVAAVRAAAADEDGSGRARRRALAMDRDWARIVERIAALIPSPRRETRAVQAVAAR